MEGEFPALPKKPLAWRGKVPCPPRENSLPRNGREFTASHWNDCVNCFQNSQIRADSERIPCRIPCSREVEDHGRSAPIVRVRIAPHHSSFTLAARPTSPHILVSVSIKRANSAAVLPTVGVAIALNFSFTSAICMILRNSLSSLRTI